MRLVIQKHAITTRCERCLPNVVEQHRDCYHVLEEAEDGSPILTLTIREGDSDESYFLDEKQQARLKTEGWESVIAEINAQDEQDSPE